MSLESVAIAFHHSKTSGTAKVVILGIANHDGDGGAWPSVATLAKYANVDVRSVQRAIDRLEKLGEIRRLTQAGGTELTPSHMRPNRYRFLLECPPWCDRTSRHKDARKPLIDIGEELYTGVTPVSPGDASVTPPVTPVSPEPSFNQTTRFKEKNPSYRTRETELCPSGHELVDNYCVLGCRADLDRKNALHGATA